MPILYETIWLIKSGGEETLLLFFSVKTSISTISEHPLILMDKVLLISYLSAFISFSCRLKTLHFPIKASKYSQAPTSSIYTDIHLFVRNESKTRYRGIGEIMIMTMRPEIMKRIRKMPLVSDLKSRRFFRDKTPETCHILEVFLSYILGEKVKVKSISTQKHGYQKDERERIADIDLDISGGRRGMVEIQNWNGNVKEVAFSRWDGIRDIQRYQYGCRKCYVIVFFNIKNGRSKVWNGFRDKEKIVYSMKPDYHEDGMDERAFPEVANGIIILLNLKKLSERDDELGEISRDLLASNEKDIKNESVRERMKEVFTNEEEKRMCIEEERFIKSMAKKLVKEHEKKYEKKYEKKLKEIDRKLEEKDRKLEEKDKKLDEKDKKLEEIDKKLEESNKQLEEKDIAHVKFMLSLGATPEEISKGIRMPLERVNAILAI